MVVYISLVLFIILFGFMINVSDRKGQIKFLAFSGLITVILMGLRFPYNWRVYDLAGYYNTYKFAISSSFNDLLKYSNWETGYLVFNFIFAKIIPWAQFIYFLEAFICVFSVCFFIYKNTDKPFLPYLFYVTLGTFTFQLSGFRQSIAMALCLISVEFIKRKKLIPFVIIVLLAATFHKTAFVFLPLYFLSNKKMKTFNNVISFIAMFIGVFFAQAITKFGNELLGTEYSGYRGNPLGGLIPIIIFSLTIILFLIFYKNKDINYNIYLNMMVLGLGIYIMRYSTLSLERISFYFTTAVIIALPTALYSIKDKYIKDVLLFLSAVLAISLYIYRLTYLVLGDYRFFWQ